MFFDVKTLLSPCVSANPANSANLGETAAECTEPAKLASDEEEPISGHAKLAEFAELASPLAGGLQQAIASDEDQENRKNSENRNVLAFQEKTQICRISEISSPLAFDENEPFTVYTSLGEPVTFTGQSQQYRDWLIKMNPKRRVR